MNICLHPLKLFDYPRGGGHAWLFINWALGLQSAGCEITWLLTYSSRCTPEESRDRLLVFCAFLEKVGLRSELAMIPTSEQNAFAEFQEEISQRIIPFEQAVDLADLLLNFNYNLDANIVGRFKRTALVDIDPGQLQIWIAQGLIHPARHQTYFSIGETVGTPEARFPDCGLQWRYTPPAVALSAWKPIVAAPSAPFTTVSGWWGEWLDFEGELYENSKRISFLEYLQVPRKTSASLELALCLGLDDHAIHRQLEENGWRIQPAWDMSFEQYQAYVEQSRGEFSCAKPSCMRLQNAWISDRSLCYLASGKPVVVQHTGPSRFLPDASGMLRFRTPEEAVRYLEQVEADYDRHCREARALAEEYFDAGKVAKRVLEQAI
jgi:hypothetical protein